MCTSSRSSLLIALLSLWAPLASAAPGYHVVVPVPGRHAVIEGISLSLADSQLPEAIVGVPFTYEFGHLLTIKGDPSYGGQGVTWKVKRGALPNGVVLTPGGVISGTPGQEGEFSFELEATYRTKSGTRAYLVKANTLRVGLSQSTLPKAKVGVAYSYDLNQLLHVTGDSDFSPSHVKWVAVQNSLPAGLALQSSGAITGTPLSVGTGALSVQAQYRHEKSDQSYSMEVIQPALARWDKTLLDLGTTAAVELAGTATLTNDGGEPADWSTIQNLARGVTAVATGCANLLPGKSCVVTFRFTPTTLEVVNLTGVAPAGAITKNTLEIRASNVQRIVTYSGGQWNLDTQGPLKITASTHLSFNANMQLNLQMWGGGGGAINSRTGWGGSYLEGTFSVLKAWNFPLTIGAGGAARTTGFGDCGVPTQISFRASDDTVYQIRAGGGYGGVNSEGALPYCPNNVFAGATVTYSGYYEYAISSFKATYSGSQAQANPTDPFVSGYARGGDAHSNGQPGLMIIR